MIFVTSAYLSPRLQYIAEILFGHILRTDYKLIQPEETAFYRKQYAEAVVISHGIKLEGTDIFIPGEALLYDNDLKELEPLQETPLFSTQGNDFVKDVFAAAFRMITEYDLYRQKDLDTHERYRTLMDGNQPWLHVLADIIWRKALNINPALKRENRGFDYRVSFDIDSPWLYRHKPLHILGGGLAKDALKADWEAMKARVSAVTGKEKDPYDVYDYIFQHVEPDRLLFFFLIDRKHTHDERHTYKTGAYRALIRSIQAKGVQAGIHPSYTSFLDKKRIAFETTQLHQITGTDITRARMHFLRYRLPETYRFLIEAGIRHDYTTASPDKIGFRHGMAIPFPWFDCEQNVKTSLWLHPTMAMDRTLQNLYKTREEALAGVKKIIDTTAAFSGEFVILLHNNALSEWKEWKGWRTVFEETIRYLHEKAKENAEGRGQ